MQKKLFFVVLAALVFSIFLRIYINFETYTEKFNSSYWEKRYASSQWVLNPKCDKSDPRINPKTCVWDNDYYAKIGKYLAENPPEQISIGDDGLYTYMGWKYITGGNPSLLNAEVPPLGKYLIGFSIVFFQNQNVFALLSGLFVLIGLFFLNVQILKNKLFAIIPVFLFSFEPIFYTQLHAPFLDLVYLGFLIMTFLFFLKKSYIVSAIFFGCMLATKNTVTTVLVVSTTLCIYLLVMKQFKELKKMMLIFFPISALTFVLTYIQYFIHGGTPTGFLKVQSWIINFYATGVKAKHGMVWEMLFTGNWPTWWQGAQKILEWRITWLILTSILPLYVLYKSYQFFKKRNAFWEPSLLIGIWCVVYLGFLSFIPVWPRYLLLVIPFLYTITMWLIASKLSMSPKPVKHKKKK